MPYRRIAEIPKEVYHYTRREHLDSILRDGRIRRFGDTETWFCKSLEDTLTLMRATVMMEGKPYYKVGGSLGFYPPFHPDEYVILKLTPRWQSGEWVHWMEELPSGTPQALVQAAERFSLLKMGFRGDLKFQPDPEIIEVAPLLAAPARDELEEHTPAGNETPERAQDGWQQTFTM